MAFLARWVGGFLASKAVTLVLMAAVAGAGTYILYVLKDRGALQERVASAQNANAALMGTINELADQRRRQEQIVARNRSAIHAITRDNAALQRKLAAAAVGDDCAGRAAPAGVLELFQADHPSRDGQPLPAGKPD